MDVVPTDRTAVPTLSDEGNRLVDAMDGIWGSTRPNGPRCGLPRCAQPWQRGHPDGGSRPTGQTIRNAPSGWVCRCSPNRSSGKAVARFSNFSGEIIRDDGKRAPHGLALRLEGGVAGTMDLVLVDITRFPSANREDFVSLTQAFAHRGFARAHRLAWLMFTGRTSFTALRGMRQRPNTSYTQRVYFGLNTFNWRLDNGDNVALDPVRYLATPRPGGGRASLGGPSAHRLDDDLRARLARNGSVWFDIELEVGRTTGIRRLSKARLLSPMERWPRWLRRERRPLCSVELTKYVEYVKADDVGLRFDVMRLPEGVEPSDDEILRARAASYPTSYLRRRGLRR